MKKRRHRSVLTVRRRLLIAFLLVALVPLAVFAFTGFSSTSQALQRQARGEMNNRSQALMATLRNEGRHGIDQVNSVGDSILLSKALEDADIRWVEKNVTNRLPERTAFKGAQVLTLDGHVVSAGGDFARAPSLFDLPIAIAAASEGTRGWDVAAVNGRIYIVSAGPVTSGPKAASGPRGVLVIGRPIDSTLLADLARYTGASQISLYANGLLLASSVHGAPANLTKGVQAGTPFTEGSSTVVLTQLRDRTGEPQGVLRVGVASGAVAVTSSNLQATGAFALVMALIVAIAVGLLVTTTIGRPLRRLTEAAAAMAGGETRQHIDVRSNDEIGDVADAFNTMSERVTQELERLSTKIKRMSTEIANLNAFGESLAQIPDVRGELQRLVRMVADIFAADYVRLYLDEQVGLVEAAAHGKMGKARAVVEELSARAADTGEAASGREHLRGADGRPPVAGEGPTVLAVPLSLNEHVAGVLVAGTSNGDRLPRRRPDAARHDRRPDRHRAAERRSIRQARCHLLPDRDGARGRHGGQGPLHGRARRQPGADGGRRRPPPRPQRAASCASSSTPPCCTTSARSASRGRSSTSPTSSPTTSSR